MNKLWSAH